MLTIKRPTESKLDEFLSSQSKSALLYSGAGLTRTGDNLLANFRKHLVSTELGFGEKLFNSATQHMRSWDHFAVDWVYLFPNKPLIAPDTILAVCANHCLLWSVNACRIIYVIDESTESKRRFGYGYGTLPDHVEQGEERFLIEWDFDSDRVTYEILAFSKPNHPLVAMLWPIAILIQDSFRKESLKALKNHLK